MPAILRKIKQNPKETNPCRGRYSPIGLDLGSAMIKMVQLQRQRGVISLAKGFIGRTPEGAFLNGELTNPDLLAHKISTVLGEQGWQTRYINISLNPHSFYFRTVSLPRMQRSALNKALYWEALQNSPLNEEEIVFDYCLIDSENENADPLQEYILAATKSKTADLYTRITDLAGLNCSALEIEPLSLFRSFKYIQARQIANSDNGALNKLSRNRPGILIHIGFCNTTLLITGTAELLFYRNIKIGVRQFLGNVQKEHNCDEKNAEKFLFSRQASADQNLRKALLARSEQFAIKVEQALNIWFDQFGQADPVLQNIQFCGGGAFIPGLAATISRHLQLKYDFYYPLDQISDSSKDSNHGVNQNRGNLFFPVAHGLALRGWNI